MRLVEALSDTAVGEQVGMAQRMESVAPAGGVMLSASTARLVEDAATLVEPEHVLVKGTDAPITAYRLLGMGDQHRAISRASRIWWVGSGRCPPLRACYIAQSTATARWSAWWDYPASARAVSCARCLRWRVVVAWRCSPPSASRTPARSLSMPWRGCCAWHLVSTSLTSRLPATGYAPSFPMPTLRICYYSTTCWGSPTRMLLYRPLIPMLVGGG